MAHHTSLLAIGLILAAHGLAQTCDSERAEVNKYRAWVAYDLQSRQSTLGYNEGQLKARIESLGQCLTGDVTAALAIIGNFANSICTSPPLEQETNKWNFPVMPKSN
jgi:hypothetical protein